MRKKLTTLILSACMLLSLFSGLPTKALAEDAGGPDAALPDGAGGGEDASDAYGLEEDTQARGGGGGDPSLSLLGLDETLAQAGELGILRYVPQTCDWSAALSRAAMAELLAGSLYEYFTPLEKYRTPEPARFTDMPSTELSPAANNAVFWLADEGYIMGGASGEFSPASAVTRAEAAALLFEIMRRPEKSYSGSSQLDIVDEGERWYYTQVMVLYDLGIVTAADGVFYPNEPIPAGEFLQWLVNMENSGYMSEAVRLGIKDYSAVTEQTASVTRAQAAELLVGFLKVGLEKYDTFLSSFGDVTEEALGQTAYRAILWCADRGYMRGNENGAFGPAEVVSRAQAALLLYRLTDRDDGGYAGGCRFMDVAESDYFYTAVMNLYELGIIDSPEAGVFDPAAPVSGADMLRWLVNLRHFQAEPTVFGFGGLNAALNDPRVQRVVATRDIQVESSFTINKDVEIYGWRSLSIDGYEVTVGGGTTLTLSGSASEASVIAGGALKVSAGGTLVCAQDLYVGRQASLIVEDGGTLRVAAGRTLYIDGSAVIDGDIVLEAGQEGIGGAELWAQNVLGGAGRIAGEGAGVNPGRVRTKESYIYENGDPVLQTSCLGSVTVSENVVKAPVKAVTVENTADFNNALAGDFLFVSVAGTGVVAASMENIGTYKHIYVLPGANLTFEDEDGVVVVPPTVLITLACDKDSGETGSMTISPGYVLEVYSDWRLEGRTDLTGVVYEKEGYWQEAAGGIIAGWKDETDDGERNPTYREYYFGKDELAGTLIESFALSLDRVELLLYGGGLTAELAPRGDEVSLDAGLLFVVGGANLTIGGGFSLNVLNGAGSGLRSAEEDGKYGRNFYYEHSAEPGYVRVGGESSLNVEGALNCETEVDWREVVAISENEAQNYRVGEKGVSFIGRDAELAGRLGVPADTLLVVFSGEDDVWRGPVEVEGGSLSAGASGAVSADHVWLGITGWNVGLPGCGFAAAEGSALRLDKGLARTVIDTFAVNRLSIEGDLDINPGCTLTVNNSLAIEGALRVYGGLAFGEDVSLNVRRGVHKMYYADKEDGGYRLGSLPDNLNEYYVGVDGEAALYSLLKDSQQAPANISLLFDWYLGGWSRFAEGNPDRTVEIDADVYALGTLQAYEEFSLDIRGTLRSEGYVRADNAAIRAGGIYNGESGWMEAVNNGRLICADAENCGYLGAYDGGQIWLTGLVSNYGRFDKNVYYDGLAARYLDWNNGAPYEDMNSDLQNYIGMPKTRRSLVFYDMSYNGPTEEEPYGSWTMTPAPAAALTLKNEAGENVDFALVALEEQGTTYENYTAFTPPYWGDFTIEYNDNGRLRSFEVHVELPQVGFYTQPYRYEAASAAAGSDAAGLYVLEDETGLYIPAAGTVEEGVKYYTRSFGASEEFWTENISYTPGEETAFYLIYNDEVSPNARAAALASYEGGENVTWERIYDADSTVWKIMVKDAATDGFGLKLGAVLEDGSGGRWEQAAWLNVNAEDYERLVWVHEDKISSGRFDEGEKRAEVVAGDQWGGAFYLYCRDGEGDWTYQPVGEAALLISGNPAGLSLTKNNGGGRPYDSYILEFKEAGAYSVKYSDGGYTCPFGVDFSVVDLPKLGVYTSQEGGKENYVNNWEMNYTDFRTVYLIPADGFGLEAMDLTKTRVGGGSDGVGWGDQIIGDDNEAVFDGFAKITAISGEGGSIACFRLDFLNNPLLTGGMNLYFSIRDAQDNEFMFAGFDFRSNIERAVAAEDGGALGLGTAGAVGAELAAGTARYYGFGAAEEGWYSFRLGGAEKAGDYGLLVFRDDWTLVGWNWGSADGENILRCALKLQAGGYRVAVFDRTGNAESGGVTLSAVEAQQPAKPAEANAKLCLSSDGIYSLRLSEGGTGLALFRLYAYIDGRWQEKGVRGLWHDDNLDRWNDEDCYLADILKDGETAEKFGVAALNEDGAESEMLELVPEKPVRRDDGAFEAPTYDVELQLMPTGDVLLSAKRDGVRVIFGGYTAGRLYHETGSGTESYRDCDIGFGDGNGRAQLHGHVDDFGRYSGGWWGFEVSRQRCDEQAGLFLVGWSEAARANDENVSGGERGSISVAEKRAWLVQDEADLSGVQGFDFRYDYGQSYWYTRNSARLWLGTWVDGEGCRYTEITSGLEASADIGLKYEDGRWSFDLSAMDAGDAFTLEYKSESGAVVASELATVVTPDSAFYTSPVPSKEGFCEWYALSSQDALYFVWDEDFEQSRGFDEVDLLVMRQAEYEPGSGLTYYERDDSTGRYYVKTDGFMPEGLYFVEDRTLILREDHLEDNYLKLTNISNRGDFDLGVVFKRRINENEVEIVDYRSLWVMQAAYMRPIGMGGFGIGVPRLLAYITEVGVAASNDATEMEGSGVLDGDGGTYVGGLRPGLRYYLYYRNGDEWVLIKGVSAVAAGIGAIEVSGQSVAVSFSLDGSHAGDLMAVASYAGGRMLGVKTIGLTEEVLASCAAQASLPEGDVYKVFVLDGESYALRAYGMRESAVS